MADLAAEEAEGLDDEVDAGSDFALGVFEFVLLAAAGDLDLISLASLEASELGSQRIRSCPGRADRPEVQALQGAGPCGRLEDARPETWRQSLALA